jgi:hypothetical protein
MDTTDLNQDEAAESRHSFARVRSVMRVDRKREWDSNPYNVFAFHVSKEIKEENPSITTMEMIEEVHRRWKNVTDEKAAKKRNTGELRFNSSPLKAPTASDNVSSDIVMSDTFSSDTVKSDSVAPGRKVIHTLSNHFD